MIIRSIRTQKYTVIPNLIIEDKNLDWKELGLLVFLLSKPDEWEVSVHHLARQRKAGRDAVLNMLKALRDAGYVEMKRKAEGGVDYIIYDTPQNRKKPQWENPEVATESTDPKPEKPLTENPTMGKATNGLSGHIVNTEDLVITEKEIVKTEREQSAPEQTQTELEAKRVADYLHNRLIEEIPEARSEKPNSWVKDIERAIRIDGRTEAELLAVIDWIHTGDKFWVSNIKSGKKLRSQFVTIVGQMRRPKTNYSKPTRRPGEFDYQREVPGERLS